MKKKMKIILILVLAVCTLITTVYVIINQSTHKKEYVSESSKKLSFNCVEESIVLSSENNIDCSEFISDEAAKYIDKIKWESSDSSVVRVNEKGIASAVSDGKAVISASVSGEICLKISVEAYGNLLKSVSDKLTKFSNIGGEAAYNDLLNMRLILKESNSTASQKLIRVIDAVEAFSQSAFDYDADNTALFNALKSAADDSKLELSQNTLRRAALTAYCMGEKNNSDVTISFTGDCTFGYFCETDPDNMFASVYRNSGSVSYPFDFVKAVFGSDDITMINYEGTITTLTEHKDKPFFFRGEPEYTNILTSSSVEAVTVENNHSFDYYDEGFLEMISYFKKAGIRYTSYGSPAVIEMDNCRVVMLSLSLVSTFYKPEFQEHIEKFINKYKRNDTIIVVNVHWGVEGSDTPEEWQIEAAHSMIDAGAELIIGHHPHRLQGIELYKGHYIAYSLGNFSFGGNSEANNPQTEILRFSFVRNGDTGMKLKGLSVVPCLTTSTGTIENNFKPKLLWGASAKDNINYLLSLNEKIDGGVRRLTTIGI